MTAIPPFFSQLSGFTSPGSSPPSAPPNSASSMLLTTAARIIVRARKSTQCTSTHLSLHVHFRSFLKHTDHCEFYKQSTKCTYCLIPLRNMSESYSARRYNGGLRGPFHPNFVQYSGYPFNDLSNFVLHVHYHFVIVDTGKELFQINPMDEVNFQRVLIFLQGDEGSPTIMVMVIMYNNYVAWTLAS